MQVNNILVDDISWNDDSKCAIVKSTLYEFRDPQWVSVHWEKEGKKIGPFTLLSNFKDDISKLERLTIQDFGERPLSIDINKKDIKISYKERWTVPPWTAYTIVIPVDFVPIFVKSKNEHGYELCPPLRIASSPYGFLFYETVLLGSERSHYFEIELLIKKDVNEFNKLINTSEVIEGKERFESLRQSVTREALSSDFWFKLLDFARKIVTG